MVAQRTIRTILVASRGEVARRIFRACRELGVTSVAVYSDVDAGSEWSRKADLSVPLRGVSAADTYLNIGAILAAARQTGADAIHPGYGFLSENAAFATACEESGLAFIGPRPETLAVMGSKLEARALAERAGVPVAPASDTAGLDAPAVLRLADDIGYPLLVKASAGGGGRGMRLARRPSELIDAVEAAEAEAASAFGDGHVFLERYFARARHVEVQILGDAHGNIVHLLERECSVQRRHQKIVEESPSPGVEDDVRARMTDAAVALARAADYVSAGTVEFLMDADGRFYFLEVNARLQVEHPITEMVTGVDIPVSQIRVASGLPLGFGQDQVVGNGHAVECRIYAEDPAQGFMPSVGRIAYYRPPAGPGVRCDDGVGTGSEVSPHYDALLAKVSTFGRDRDEALRRMAQALADTVVLGVTTNLTYLQDLIHHAAFRAGDTHTHFVDEHMTGWKPPSAVSEEDWLAMAAFESLSTAAAARAERNGNGGARYRDPWSVAEAWRNVP